MYCLHFYLVCSDIINIRPPCTFNDCLVPKTALTEEEPRRSTGVFCIILELHRRRSHLRSPLMSTYSRVLVSQQQCWCLLCFSFLFRIYSYFPILFCLLNIYFKLIISNDKTFNNTVVHPKKRNTLGAQTNILHRKYTHSSTLEENNSCRYFLRLNYY